MAVAPETGNLLSVRHSAVPGRLRLAVAGIRRHPERARAAEQIFLGIPGVHSATANHLTGNLLVLFDPTVHAIPAILDSAMQAMRGKGELGPHPDPLPKGEGDAKGDGDAQHSSPITYHPSPITHHPALSTQHSAPYWHALSAAEVARKLNVTPEVGLDLREAAARLRQIGPNRLPEPEETPLLRLVVRQFLNAPSALLGVGALLSLATGAVVDAVLIGGVLIANAAIGAATERSGQRAIAALRRTVPIRARVQRGGTTELVDADRLVPGDLVQLLPGDPAPADARIWDAHRLQVEESALTGESRPVAKSTEPVDVQTPLADRHSMIYRGTTVVGGHGTAIVVATGHGTAIGGVRALAAGAEAPPTPLERDLAQIGRQLVVAATSVSLGVMGLGLIRGMPLGQAMMTAVALGVAAIPEGLPTTATAVLALGSGRMRRKGTLIRSLHAAEALGSVTVVCADKTGTLTENRMAVAELRLDHSRVRVMGSALSAVGTLLVDGRRVSPEDNPALAETLRIGVLCSDAEIVGRPNGALGIDGSSTEGALLVAALKAGLDLDDLRGRHPRIDRRDRGDGRRYMVTVHRGPEGLVALAKGAPDEMLEICDQALVDGTTEPLSGERRADFLQHNAEMAGRAMRVLAFASKSLPEAYGDEDLSTGFTLCGLAGLTDPVRPAAPEAVRALHQAGIRTIMITGDQAATATAVARELGLERAGPLHLLEAGDLTTMDPEVLRGLVPHIGVFARVPPETKLSIVRALQANGEVVAMTGDGVNDAPALRAADVGVAMGERGTELARELADVVLSTDDFSRMVNAVEEGRLVRANVRRVLHYLLSTNASEVWAVTTAVALGLPSPLTPGQLLWLNLISDLTPALGLAMEPRDPDLMKRPPSDPSEPIVPPSLQRRILGESALLATGSLAAYGLGILRHGPGPVAQTMAFSSLATAQLLHVPLARAGARPALGYERAVGRPLVIGVGISALLQLAVVLLAPLRSLLGARALAPADALISLIAAVAPVAAIEMQRRAAKRSKAPPAETAGMPRDESGGIRPLKEAA